MTGFAYNEFLAGYLAYRGDVIPGELINSVNAIKD